MEATFYLWGSLDNHWGNIRLLYRPHRKVSLEPLVWSLTLVAAIGGPVDSLSEVENPCVSLLRFAQPS